MSLQRIEYTDTDGRKKVVLLPEGTSKEQAEIGIPVGPPNLEALGLPLELEVRLSNELFNRNILTQTDALKRRSEIAYALQAALKLDVESILNQYLGGNYQAARAEVRAEAREDSVVPNRRNRTRTRRRN